MNDYRIYIVIVFCTFAALEMLSGRFLHRSETKSKDIILEVVAGLTIPILIAPTILFTTAFVVEWWLPGSQNAWSHWAPWQMFAVLLIADDLSQYGWHRLSHNTPWLYAFHRAHHSGRYMSVRIVYRNSLLYYAFMPGLWLSAVLIHLGFGPVYLVYIIAKMAVIISAHSSVPWDKVLWEHRGSRAFMWVICRIISTPMTHSAHHGRHRDDGVTHYKGNYGNFLFFWDILFGTAKISHERPQIYGIEDEAPVPWLYELLWPFPPK